MNREFRKSTLERRLISKSVAALTVISSAALLSVVPASAVSPENRPATAKCLAGAPSLAVRVGWKVVDNFNLAMQTHVQVANCRGRIKAVRIIVDSYRAGGTGRVERDVFRKSTEPKKYANTAMMVHQTQYLRALYFDEDPGRIKGIVLDERISYNNLQSCSLMTDATPIDTSDYSFSVRVEPLDAKRRVIKNVGAAYVGPFACGQFVGTE